MLFSYKATVTSTYDSETVTYRGVVNGDNYEGAVIKLEEYFRKELDEFSIKIISSDNFIILEKNREELYSNLVKALEEDAVW